MNVPFISKLEVLLKEEAHDRNTWYVEELFLQTPKTKKKIIKAIADINETGI